ncbi:MAG: class I SAM-dependent methyltransferase, partial [Rhodothermales bacterium]
GDQRRFWNKEASRARFSHPLNRGWLEQVVQSNSAILDYGCGYGRTVAELQKLGYANITGLDTSRGMLDRAAALAPNAPLVLGNGVPSPLPDASFELVILFAVLTTIPDDRDQRALIEDIRRILCPGGHLYVSDLPLQRDERRVKRYETLQPEGLPYGTFTLDGGRAVMRHHSLEWFEELFVSFRIVDRASLSVDTMRGRTADAVQFLLQKHSN